MLKYFIALTVGMMLFAETRAQPPNFAPAPGAASNQVNLDLPRFDLDFPGGNPESLILEINERLRGSPVNVIIPSEYNDVQIPPMKLKNVTVQQVFDALGRASQRMVPNPTMSPYAQGSQAFTSYYTFQANPPIQTNSVWYFVYLRPPQSEPQKICRFYQLASYLQQGLNINDITTAIKAGYKMLDEPAPELNFHNETQILIACGSPSKMRMIDEVLSALPRAKEPANAGPRPVTVPLPAR
jgi:hypothetical protein